MSDTFAGFSSNFNWYDTRASTWYEGYLDSHAGSGNTGNLVNLKSLEGTDQYAPALQAITNNLIGLFEQKGVTAKQAQSSPEFQRLLDLAKEGNTKEAFQGGASAVTSARDRGDLWGADVSEGGEQGFGRSYLEDVAAGKITNPSVEELYKTGLLRDPKDDGLDYWSKELSDYNAAQYLRDVGAGTITPTDISELWTKGLQKTPEAGAIPWGQGYAAQHGIPKLADWMSTNAGVPQGMNLSKIAESFLLSDEAMIQDVYHQQYGRMALDEGLNYWSKSNDASVSGISDAQNLLNVISYKGEDLDGDGVITAEERAASEHTVSAETAVLDDMQNLLGLVSNEENKESVAAAGGPFTAANTADVLELVDYIRNSSDPAAASVNANTLIAYLAHVKDAINLGNVDDSGDQATHMGQFGTKEEIKAMLDAYVGTDTSVSNLDNAITNMPKDQDNLNALASTIIDKTGQEKWDTLTTEETKTADDVWVPWTNPFGATYAGEHGVAPTLSEDDAEQILQPENLELWKAHGAFQTKPTPTQGTDTQHWSITPTKPNLPTPLSINKSDVDYLTVAGSDVQDTSGYGQAKTQFDNAMSSAQPQGGTATAPKVGKRLIDTSAKGVRRRKSPVSTSGKSLGTQAFHRSQINSLNI